MFVDFNMWLKNEAGQDTLVFIHPLNKRQCLSRDYKPVIADFQDIIT